MWEPIIVNQRFTKIDVHSSSACGVIMYYLIFQVTSLDQLFKWSCDFLGRSHHIDKFGDLKHCGSVNITFLVCYVILQDHLIKEPCNFMSRGLSWKVTVLLNVVVIGILGVKI